MQANDTAATLLSCAEMARADALTIAGGISGEALMETAGAAVARAIKQRFARQSVIVLCGPGNNGGDGFVIARHLQASGWTVRLALLGARDALKGDAALHAARWQGPVETLATSVLDGATLAVDALFGAGLGRALESAALAVVEEINWRGLACVGVDVPSGVAGDSGQVLGAAPQCRLTVTFFRRKPGHLLAPGRFRCGEVVVANIGIPATVLAEIQPRIFANDPVLWLSRFPWPRAEGHKYARGHAVINAGGLMTGAGRLSARAALRVGAGLVTLACPSAAVPIYAGDLASTLIAPADDQTAFAALLADPRKNAVLLGPGNGVTMATQMRVQAALAAGKACVLDADAISVFAEDPGALFRFIRAPVLLTPHEGEFARLFKSEGDKLTRAREAAKLSGAVVLLKGPDTVIAAPDGRAVINSNAPPDLATAGAGDVLAGLAVGLMAQGVDAFDAGCMAAWLHGAAATAFGPGLVAEDLPDQLPAVLRQLKAALSRA
jgi:ADP-dependent NAD(P)H-hydrate dehydratase / NAD(P)H-hydrate epimerase